MMRTKFLFLIESVLFVFLIVAVGFGGRYITYKQTDPMDIVTRNKIDRDIDAWIEKLDRQIQIDTLALDLNETNTADTVYLENKYKDMGYNIFLLCRWEKGTQAGATSYVYPLSDSSFVIADLNALDSSTVQWMTIYK